MRSNQARPVFIKNLSTAIKCFRSSWRIVLFLTSIPALQLEAVPAPRIVNVYCFCRENDFRTPRSESVLFNATVQQIRLLKKAGLTATFALQYDALMDPKYQKLFKEELGTNDEIAAWWEIPEELVERAGLKWRGRHEWDPAADVGFSPGYTPEERRKLVDAYMADFKAIFGYYPRTAGSWYIDEVTLAYMAQHYGIVASCNCKDQIGTDGYTLWGGYWNQAYYPSRLNAYMPAQSRAGQIDVPIFRMLGSDPIYQHGTTPGLVSLEPVYKHGGGGMPQWVDWFMDNLIQGPSLAFGYTQAGQENSFGWEAMKDGLNYQVNLFAKLARAGDVQIETLAQAGEWFRNHYTVTPPTAVVSLDDWKHENRKSAWYDSRFYRVNVLWEKHCFFIRDLHCFDQNMASATYATALTSTSLACETLPVMDWALWSRSGGDSVGMWPVLLSADGMGSTMSPGGAPVIKELNSSELSIRQPLQGGGTFTIVCGEKNIVCNGVDQEGRPLPWAWNLVGGVGQRSVVEAITPQGITYHFKGVRYRLGLSSDAGNVQQLGSGDIQIRPNNSGLLSLTLGTAIPESSTSAINTVILAK